MTELIDKNELLKKAVMISGPSGKSTYSVVFADDITNTKAIESYTKADLVTMLTELQLEIEEYQYEDKYDAVNDDMTGWILAVDVNKLVQQKINSLKENKEDGNDN